MNVMKFFVDGKYITPRSGAGFKIYQFKSKRVYAQASSASRRELQVAVEAARNAQPRWAGASAFGRSQVLYRAAEKMEERRLEFLEILRSTAGFNSEKANHAVDRAVDGFVYYAGFADKFHQVASAINPVSGPLHNYTTPEAVGVVGLIASEEYSADWLGDLVSELSAITCSGNSAVVLLSGEGAALIQPLAEVIDAADFPMGTVNLLSGNIDESVLHFGSHRGLDALSYQGESKELMARLRALAASNMKRIAGKTGEPLSLHNILSFVEFKTVWQQVGC